MTKIHMKTNWIGCGSGIRNVPAAEIRQGVKKRRSQTARVGMIPLFFFQIPAVTELKIPGELLLNLIQNIPEMPHGQDRREGQRKHPRLIQSRIAAEPLPAIPVDTLEKRRKKQDF